ncbi:bacillithiol biosynthesis cysteine-adding enzyme BshC [Paenibacillus eucommiae]|uniref:Putative cysteine ligase BshC n=1 Tax=Paenibacillus eucommiae TaxID=1355755 RepID=A0ABS4IYZ8_9BACL|nr:bacillithiol biosynthesis cysteine-adding enzyme BshC [Paenibacillus eucommiae]MBP1992807.1 bacillithiol biosynthesis cysteine-adding enzyme BshC [Paenibacillus eucommiae]
MPIEAVNWKRNQPLAQDYIEDKISSRELFEYHYLHEAAWFERAEFVKHSRSPRADSAELVKVLTDYNVKIGNAPEALEKISMLLDPSALVVVGGQQAGLFGGQLMILYKAISIIQAARTWSEKLNRPVLPVFWVAGEDHDFDEVNHIHYLSAQLQVEKLQVEHPTGARTAVSRLPLQADAWARAVEELEASLIDTEFKAGLLDKLRAVTSGSVTLTDTFAAIMASLLGEYGLVLLDSDDPALRQLEAPMFQQLVQRNADLSAALQLGRSQVEAAGYVPQAEVAENGANLFIFEGDRRLLLQRDGELFADKKKTFSISQEELGQLAQNQPERLSNNVLTRPLMQEFLFPVLATVLGPGEIAYWGLTGEAFHLFGMKMPVVAPRLEFTLVEGTLQKHLSKYDLTLEDIRFRFEEKQQQWLESQDKLNLAQRFDGVKDSFRESYSPLVESLAAINPGVRKLGETNMLKIIEQIEFLEGKAADAYKTHFEAALRQLERIKLSIIPLAKPQERVYNIYAYLNRYGEDWLKPLIETSMPIDGMHRIYYL